MSNITPTINNYKNKTYIEKALLCAYLCNMSYMSEDNLYKWISEINDGSKTSSILNYYHYKSLQLFILETEEERFIVFRGTDIDYGIKEAIKDIMVSINMFPYREDHIIYHKGYYDSANEVFKKFKEDNILSSNKQLILVGHSMGAAISKIISTKIDLEHSLMTFGSPQVSYQGDSGEYIKEQFHFINDSDIIPYFPSLFYRDNITNILISSKSKNFKILGKLPFKLFNPLFKLIIYSFKRNCSLFDKHKTASYIRALYRIVKDNK